jgi:hypothetical protein
VGDKPVIHPSTSASVLPSSSVQTQLGKFTFDLMRMTLPPASLWAPSHHCRSFLSLSGLSKSTSFYTRTATPSSLPNAYSHPQSGHCLFGPTKATPLSVTRFASLVLPGSLHPIVHGIVACKCKTIALKTRTMARFSDTVLGGSFLFCLTVTLFHTRMVCTAQPSQF